MPSSVRFITTRESEKSKSYQIKQKPTMTEEYYPTHDRDRKLRGYSKVRYTPPSPPSLVNPGERQAPRHTRRRTSQAGVHRPTLVFKSNCCTTPHNSTSFGKYQKRDGPHEWLHISSLRGASPCWDDGELDHSAEIGPRLSYPRRRGSCSVLATTPTLNGLHMRARC